MPDWLVQRLNSKPKLAFGLDFYLDSFWNLSTERQYSEAILNIPWSKIQEYAEYYGMDFGESEQFHYLMKKMDTAYIDKMRENAKPVKPPIEPREPVGKRAKGNPR